MDALSDGLTTSSSPIEWVAEAMNRGTDLLHLSFAGIEWSDRRLVSEISGAMRRLSENRRVIPVDPILFKGGAIKGTAIYMAVIPASLNPAAADDPALMEANVTNPDVVLYMLCRHNGSLTRCMPASPQEITEVRERAARYDREQERAKLTVQQCNQLAMAIARVIQRLLAEGRIIDEEIRQDLERRLEAASNPQVHLDEITPAARALALGSLAAQGCPGLSFNDILLEAMT